jgi:hypothetical protein
MKGEEVELGETKGGTLVELAGVRGGVGLPGRGDECCWYVRLLRISFC